VVTSNHAGKKKSC